MSRALPTSLRLAAVLGLAAFALPALGAPDAVGPPVGNNRYQGTISDADDADDFAGRFLPGEVLTVVVTALRAPKSKDPPTLRPVLVLVDPDGLVRSAGAVTSANGLAVAYRNLVVDKPGVWAARVSGNDDTTGDFAVAFKVKPRPKSVLRGVRLGEDAPFFLDVPVPAVEGAVLTATAVDSKKGTPVTFRHLIDPSGASVSGPGGGDAVAAAVRKGTKLELKGVVLGRGTGGYVLRVGIPNGRQTFSLTVSLVAPKRPVSKKTVVLGPVEPRLDPADVPFAGEPGDTVRFTGSGFSTAAAPAVLFGTSPSAAVTVGDGGTTLDVVVPPKTGGDFVPVYVVNPDGQGTARDAYFAYVPPPAITDLVDLAGTPVRTSPAAGGRAVRLRGTHILEGYAVRVGTTAVSKPFFADETEVRFSLPALPDGTYPVTVTDPYRRSATSAFTVRYKTPPAFAASPYSPAALRIGVPTTLTITGTGFLPSDRVVFQGQDVATVLVGPTTRTFDLPPFDEGTLTFRIVDEIGTVVDGPALAVKPPPAVTTVAVVNGPLLGTREIPLAGGSTIQVDGTAFLAGDTVTLGGVAITSFSVSTSTRKTFVAPAGSPGLATLVVTDGAGQSATVDGAVRYVGFRDVTGSRAPAGGATDAFAARRGAAGDLDGDGREDDVVLVSPYGASIGTRTELTRVLLGNSSGALVDATATAIPAAGSDSTGFDAWDAHCVAVGDLDASGVADIVIGGQVTAYGGYAQVRLLMNDGTGRFGLDETNAPPSRYDAAVFGYVPPGGYYYYYGYYATVYSASQQRGTTRAVALGDLDDDGDPDLVVGTDHFQSRYVYVNPAYVDFTQTPPLVTPGYAVFYAQYLAALRIYDNDLAGGNPFADVSGTRVPSAGRPSSTTGQPAALHSRDLALGDLDQDGDLDLVVAWDDPSTVTAYGLATFEAYGSSYDTPKVATRVLLNDGTGAFPTDSTPGWMPSASDPEFWQASRIALGDLDNDGDPDLALLLGTSLDGWKGGTTRTRRALRVLRNDRTRFVDVTGTALPGPVAANSDDFRGEALAIRDVNGDGFADVLVSTREALRNGANAAVPRTRVFYGGTGLRFALRPEFGEPATTDTGEADDLLFVGDLGGSGVPVLVLVGEQAPAASPSGATLRAEEWRR